MYAHTQALPTNECVYTGSNECVYTCTHTRTNEGTHVRMHAHINACTHVHTHTHAHAHAHTLRDTRGTQGDRRETQGEVGLAVHMHHNVCSCDGCLQATPLKGSGLLLRSPTGPHPPFLCHTHIPHLPYPLFLCHTHIPHSHMCHSRTNAHTYVSLYSTHLTLLYTCCKVVSLYCTHAGYTMCAAGGCLQDTPVHSYVERKGLPTTTSKLKIFNKNCKGLGTTEKEKKQEETQTGR